MTSDGKFSDFNEGVPQAFICKQEEGRFRDVSVNDSSNRVFFVDDVTSVMYVCDLTYRALLFKVRTHIRYPLCVYARGEVVTVYNYTSKRLTFYTQEGELISIYPLDTAPYSLTFDSCGSLLMCAGTLDCITEMYDSYVSQFGSDWLKSPTNITSSGDFVYVLDSSKYCCHIVKDRVCLKSILRYYPRDVRQVTFPVGMCTDEYGNIIICDSGDGAIVIFNREGVRLKRITSVGSYDRKGLKSVKSIDISSKGELIVACRINGHGSYVI